jgi:putative tryptophan/tyrosine transport system substrate-binding protein
MNRRVFIAAVGFGGLVAPARVAAQPAGRTARIGHIINSNPAESRALSDALRQGLGELGWVAGRNLNIEYRWAEGDLGRLPRLVAEMVGLKVEVIVLAGTAAARAAIEGARTTPIVVTAVGDPVAAGLVTSLSRPGGNLTGLAWQASDLVTKQLQLLLEAVPRAGRIAALGHSANPTMRVAVESAARSLGVTIDVFDVGAPADIPGAFEAAKRKRPGALIVLPSPMFYAERRRLAALAARDRLPAIYEVKAYVDAGGMASYGPSFPEMYRRSATYVDKILNGVKPGDLPMEQPTKFELAINFKTAKALGLTIPPLLLQRVDHLVE